MYVISLINVIWLENHMNTLAPVILNFRYSSYKLLPCLVEENAVRKEQNGTWWTDIEGEKKDDRGKSEQKWGSHISYDEVCMEMSKEHEAFLLKSVGLSL